MIYLDNVPFISICWFQILYHCVTSLEKNSFFEMLYFYWKSSNSCDAGSYFRIVSALSMKVHGKTLCSVYCWSLAKFMGKNRSLNCQLISNSVIQIHSFCLVRYYAGLALIVLVPMVGEADGQDFFCQKQLVSIFFCSITCFWAHNSEYKHLIPWYWTELVILFCSLTNKNRLKTKK